MGAHRYGRQFRSAVGVRRFQVDIDLHGDLSRAVQTDRLDDTVDYHAVCAMVEEIGTSRTFHLLEGLAGAMANALGERFPEMELELEVRKINPPCPGNPTFTAVRLIRPSR